ncbi:hypothetical protein R6Z02_16275 [Carnobacterium maltaromaticum]|uniref:hypothetical protein n=1 Tax=Carnobacterium maltaromaticum TaxID=2751 RepID=UPI00298A90C4|nr:hypothetical protein [Carnobacterium maltaromaticum]MDW5525296.1 hypothetical protein [Carnobacterium maltaromaticum]
MKKKFNIYQFEFGTVTEEEILVKIEIETTQFSHDTLKEITELPTNEDQLFLDIEQIKESENSIVYKYKKSNRLKNLITIKNEAYPVKLSIAQKILQQDILQQYSKEDIYISLNPSTIYYHPMQTVLYTYSANRFMPRDNHTTIERYKALIVSILSGIAYEKCLNSPKDVSKEGNDFIKEIYQQKNVSDLLSLVQQSNDYKTYDYIENRKKAEDKIKKNYFYLLTGVIALSLASISLLGVKVSGQAEALSTGYEKQLTEKDTLLQANDNFYKGNYDEAIALYEKTDYDTKQLAADLIEKGEYQKAIDIDPASLEKVIKTIYDHVKPEVLLELNDKKLNEKEQAKLADEKGIVNGDTTAMLNTLNFLKDEQTAVRLANKFVEIDDLNNAKKVVEKYPENKEIMTIVENADIEKGNQEKERAEIQKQIEEKKKKVDESTDDKEKEELKKEISGLQEKVK